VLEAKVEGALAKRGSDKNTKFFHQIANSNRRCNIVENLVINGIASSNPAYIKEHIIQFTLSSTLRMSIGPRRCNIVENLVINGIASSNPAYIKEHIIQFILSSTLRMSIGP
jgi:hypothetical protein